MLRYTVWVAIFALAVIGGLAWYLLSPAYSLGRLSEAALAGDEAELTERVDFPAMRQSLKSELRDQLAAASKESGTNDDPLAAIGSAIARSMIDPVVDGMVSTQGVSVLVTHGRLETGHGAMTASWPKPIKWTIEREGLNRMFASPSSGKGDSSVSLAFERDGLGWKLVGIDLDRERPAK